jgi:ketosteroid isomerase-like protein
MVYGELIEEMFRQIDAGNLQGLEELVTDDFKFEMPGISTSGLGEYRGLYRPWRNSFSCVHHTVASCLESESMAWVEVLFVGTQVVALPGERQDLEFPRDVSFTAGSVFGFRSGKIAWRKVFMSPSDMGLDLDSSRGGI